MNAHINSVISDILDTVLPPLHESDAVSHLTRTDPGASLPGDCLHSWRLNLRDGRTVCRWCHVEMEDEP